MAILDGLNGTLQLGSSDSATNATTLGLNHDLFGYLLSIGLIAPIAFAIYRTGLYGGADSKALFVIAILIPPYTIGSLGVASIHGFSALTVLTNAVILSMAHVCYNLVRNCIELAKGAKLFDGFEESSSRKALAFAVGYRSSAPRGYLYALECTDQDTGRRKFRFNPSNYDEYVDEQSQTGQISCEGTVEQTGRERVWVTQALPFIVYIGAGFGVMLIIGDLMAVLLQALT
jgi:preflagellin peptidase FlaK